MMGIFYDLRTKAEARRSLSCMRTMWLSNYRCQRPSYSFAELLREEADITPPSERGSVGESARWVHHEATKQLPKSTTRIIGAMEEF